MTDADAVLDEFLRSLDELDVEATLALFADDATMILPSAQARRASNRDEFEPLWRRVIAALAADRPAGATLGLDVCDRVLQVDGDVAWATFHVRMSERLGRRTFVLRRRAGRWQIVHLHASNVDVDPA